MSTKIELCSYSGYKVYAGHGKRVVKPDGKVVVYLSQKCQRSADMKRNPRNITWTVLYRRKHKKGVIEEQSKKKTRRTTKFTRAITGASLNDIMAKRDQKPEFRKMQREQAIRAAKQAVKEKRATKKATSTTSKAKPAPQKPIQKAPKQAAGAKPRVGGKR